MQPSNDNDIADQNHKAAKAMLDAAPTLLEDHPHAIPEVLLPGGMGRVITINEDA